jgi:hypothetical protein
MPRRLEELDGEWRCRHGSTVVVEQAVAMRAQRVGSRMDWETTEIREEGVSSNSLFLFPCG